MSLPLKIPVGSEPDWEESDRNDDASLNSISESSALYYSLRQSRNAWLTSIFPKFTSKSKAKGQKDVVQPPHNLRFIAKCDIEIGPHIFPETSVYEAHYLSESPPFVTGFPAAFTAPYPATTSGTYTYPLTSYSPYVAPTPPPNFPNVTSTSTTEARDPSLDVTPALIAQVNEAAATNPTLHNLLQIAAAGEATMDQLRTLGFFIQQLATAQQQSPAPMPSSNFVGAQPVTPPTTAFLQAAKYSPPHVTPKNPDLVLEFRENHMDRFLVPREIVACEQEIPPSQTFRKDIVLYTFVPFVNDETKFKAGVTDTSRTPTIIRFLNVSDAIWESIRGWVNEEAKRTDAWDSFYDKAEASGPRTYLQYRLPDGDLLSQLRMACENGYTMKSIKPTPTSESTTNKRSRPRKVTTRTPAEANGTNEAPSSESQVTPQSGAYESTSTKETELKRRKSLPKTGSRSNPRTGHGLFFINTIAPPPPPPPPAPQLHPETPHAPIPQPSPTISAPAPTITDNV